MASLLIIYASKTGTTKDVAYSIATAFLPYCDIYNCRERIMYKSGCTRCSQAIGDATLDGYDIVVLGTAMYMGRPIKEFMQFCKVHQNELSRKKLILFTCGVGIQEEDQKYLYQHIPESITREAGLYFHLGGEIRAEQMGFFSRMAMKQYEKQNGCIASINKAALEMLKEEVKKLI